VPLETNCKSAAWANATGSKIAKSIVDLSQSVIIVRFVVLRAKLPSSDFVSNCNLRSHGYQACSLEALVKTVVDLLRGFNPIIKS